MTVSELIDLLYDIDPSKEILVPSAVYVADEFGYDTPTKTYIKCFKDMTEERKKVLRYHYNDTEVDIENTLIIDMEAK